MHAIYQASVKNVRELKKQVKIVKRLLNQALRTNRMQEVDALTKTFALMYSAYAEVSFIKLIHTPYGFFRIIYSANPVWSQSGREMD